MNGGQPVIRGEVIERLARGAYRSGISPVDLTEAVVGVVTEEALNVPAGDPVVILLSRRVIAALLDLGWRMPGQAGEPCEPESP